MVNVPLVLLHFLTCTAHSPSNRHSYPIPARTIKHLKTAKTCCHTSNAAQITSQVMFINISRGLGALQHLGDAAVYAVFHSSTWMESEGQEGYCRRYSNTTPGSSVLAVRSVGSHRHSLWPQCMPGFSKRLLYRLSDASIYGETGEYLMVH